MFVTSEDEEPHWRSPSDPLWSGWASPACGVPAQFSTSEVGLRNKPLEQAVATFRTTTSLLDLALGVDNPDNPN